MFNALFSRFFTPRKPTQVLRFHGETVAVIEPLRGSWWGGWGLRTVGGYTFSASELRGLADRLDKLSGVDEK